MKYIAILAAALALAVNCSATGALQINSTQTGFLYYTNGAGTNQVITFEPGFSYPPAFSAYLVGGVTNSLPFTYSVTASNVSFNVNGIAANVATKAAIAWTASAVATRVQYGTLGPGGGTATTLTATFTSPFISTPVAVAVGSVSPGATNNGVAITTLSATNLVVTTGNTNQTVYWQAIGPSAARAVTGPNGSDGVITY